jgi:hypothetical protein
MRNDAIGFFWDDTPPPEPPKKEPEKRTPPKPTWLAPDYLPGLEEALRFPCHVMTDAELHAAQLAGEILVNDTECFPNYFLSMFVSKKTGWVTFVEMIGDQALDTAKLRWILDNFETVGFNSATYDMTMNAMALAGFSTAQLKQCSDKLILEELRPSDVLRAGGVKKLEVDHIDIIEIAPLSASLKTYGGRLHVPKLQDLPFHPNTVLSPEQIAIVRWYCRNDCNTTAFVHEHLLEHIELRKVFGAQYGVDLRSRSDPQMAEEVIRHEIKKVTGTWPKKPKYGSAVGQTFRYQPPGYISFYSHELQTALLEMSTANIVVGPTGHAECPKVIRERVVTIADKKYKVGMGGLHSTEKRQAVVSNDFIRIFDRDVTGYYPNLILHNGFAPPSLGNVFLTALRRMVQRRTNAKQTAARMADAGDTSSHSYITAKTEADGLKIANNGIFGKLSDPFSTVYDVPNMVQVTLTGQLSLLMAIELLEMHSIPVISANTDGIVVACPRARYQEMCDLFKQWEQRTGLETEETEYAGLFSRDVNNYIAVKPDRKTKTKGAYCERGSAHNSVLSKNPEVLICSDAAQAWLSKGTPVEETIHKCKDIRRFVSVRVVSGGGVKVWSDDHTEYLGKTVRWYYAKDIPGEIVYATTGNKVPRSEGAKPCMALPAEFPTDIDYDWYVSFAYRILSDIGAIEEPPATAEAGEQATSTAAHTALPLQPAASEK